jgi:hypothetical protein
MHARSFARHPAATRSAPSAPQRQRHGLTTPGWWRCTGSRPPCCASTSPQRSPPLLPPFLRQRRQLQPRILLLFVEEGSGDGMMAMTAMETAVEIAPSVRTRTRPRERNATAPRTATADDDAPNHRSLNSQAPACEHACSHAVVICVWTASESTRLPRDRADCCQDEPPLATTPKVGKKQQRLSRQGATSSTGCN